MDCCWAKVINGAGIAACWHLPSTSTSWSLTWRSSTSALTSCTWVARFLGKRVSWEWDWSRLRLMGKLGDVRKLHFLYPRKWACSEQAVRLLSAWLKVCSLHVILLYVSFSSRVNGGAWHRAQWSPLTCLNMSASWPWTVFRNVSSATTATARSKCGLPGEDRARCSRARWWEKKGNSQVLGMPGLLVLCHWRAVCFWKQTSPLWPYPLIWKWNPNSFPIALLWVLR